jgi:hypothetical protein
MSCNLSVNTIERNIEFWNLEKLGFIINASEMLHSWHKTNPSSSDNIVMSTDPLTIVEHFKVPNLYTRAGIYSTQIDSKHKLTSIFQQLKVQFIAAKSDTQPGEDGFVIRQFYKLFKKDFYKEPHATIVSQVKLG